VIGVPGSGYDEIPYLVAGSAARRGKVTLAGHDVASPAAFARAGGRLIPADRGRSALVGAGTVVENFMLGHRGGQSRWGLRQAARERATVAEAVRRYGVKCASITDPITALSGGNQQKLIMARCLEARPRLLVVHEPTQGVDIRARADLLAHLHSAVRERALAVLYVCGDLDEVWDNAHRVVVVRRGRLAGSVSGGAKESVHSLLY
jgi:ABC-type sugar transport system ATPase subunit